VADDINNSIGFELESNKLPLAVIIPLQQEAVIGSIVKMDGRQSVDPEGSGLTYSWSFAQIPIGSQVERFGFNNIEEDGSVVGFAPDIVGTYKVRLVVNDGSLDSEPTEGQVDTRAILVPHHHGLVPDASFIWNYLSDFWRLVDGKKKFEIFWSSAIQVVAAEMLKMYQYDYNKSIKDIQDVIQKKWAPYTPGLPLDDQKVSFLMSMDRAGVQADTFDVSLDTGLSNAVSDYTTFIGIPKSEGSLDKTVFGSPTAPGLVTRIGNRSFTLSRVSGVSRAVIHNFDGIIIPNHIVTSTLGGFLSTAIGDTVAFIGPGLPPSAKITFIFDDNAVLVDGPIFPGIFQHVEFTVTPAVPNNNALFMDQEQVPSRLANKPWRLSATLVSSELDFEEQGVSIGDVVEVQVSRQDVSLTGNFFAQVVSVDRSRLGFLLNTDDLVDGVAGKELSVLDQASLAVDLQVPGLFINPDGSLFYTDQSQVIHDTITSYQFRRKYFEKEINSSTVIDVGAFSITVRPLQVIRNKVIPVDLTVRSIPVLQEYVRQPELVTNGNELSVITPGGVVKVTHEPFVLIENLDYVVDDDKTITGSCRVVLGSDVVEIPFGDLVDRSVLEGDSLHITNGSTVYSFQITAVLDSENVRVTPVPGFFDTSAVFELTRKTVGRFIRFTNSVFTKKIPAPSRLWAEVTYFDNNEAVENNFGVLVGLTRDDLERANSGIPYKSAVAGLMYALTKGPTVANLELAAQILLGLPFTQLPGIITEINPEFRKSDDGAPLFGRILVEVRDREDKPTGVTNIYLYPQGRQIPDPDNPGKFLPAVPELSGLATNPDTGVVFVVGDRVAQFVPLSKGVQVREYVGTPNWFADQVNQGSVKALIEKFHSFNLRINSDLISDSDINLAASFIKKAKPTYTKLTSGLLKAVEDEVDIDDVLSFQIDATFFDNTGLSLPTAVKLDVDDFDDSFLDTEGTMYSVYHRGEDLVTTKGSLSVLSAAGGFLTALTGSDSPKIKEKDVLRILSGPNAGRYAIATAASDTQLSLVAGAFDFQTLTQQVFVVYRPVVNPIWVGTANVTQNSSQVDIVGHGIGSAGIAVGDVFVFQTSLFGFPRASRIYTVTSINPPTNVGTESFFVTPAVKETTASGATAAIVREGLLTRTLLMGTHSSFPTQMRASFSNGSIAVQFLTGTHFLNLAVVRPGDKLTYLSNVFTVRRSDHQSGTLYMEQPATFTATDVVVSVERPSAPTTPVSLDMLDRMPREILGLDFVLPTTWLSQVPIDGMVTLATSDQVHTANNLNFATMGVLPGDFVLILSGPDSTFDLGDGPGVFTIESLASSTVLQLVNSMSSTSAGTGVRYGIRRKRPNEG
jgi:hypothetical protein